MTNDQLEHGKPPLVACVLWFIFYFIMWFWVVNGSLFFVLGVVSYFVDLGDFFSKQGGFFVWPGGGLTALGITFVWLHGRRHIRFVGDKSGAEPAVEAKEARPYSFSRNNDDAAGPDT
jgi:hypothetical protein